MNIKKSQNNFKLWCQSNRLRLKIDQDNTPIAITRSKKYPHDHFFEGFENGDIGLHISRPTKKTFNNIMRRLIALGCSISQRGDREGNFRLKMDEAGVGIGSMLKIKKKASNGLCSRNLFKKKSS